METEPKPTELLPCDSCEEPGQCRQCGFCPRCAVESIDEGEGYCHACVGEVIAYLRTTQPSGGGAEGNGFEAAVKQMHNGYTEHFKTPESPLAAIQQLVAESRALAISEVELLNPHIKLDLPDEDNRPSPAP